MILPGNRLISTWITGCGLCLLTHLNQVWAPRADSRPITLGAIFEANGDMLEDALKFAINHVNSNEMTGTGLHLTYIVNTTSKIMDPFNYVQIVCEQASMGVVGYIGPLTSTIVRTVAPLVGAMNLPLIAPFATSPMLAHPSRYPFVVRLSPPDSLQGLALVDLVAHFGWKKMAILTSDSDYGVHGLVSFAAEAARRGWHVVSVQLFQVTAKVSHIDVSRQLAIIRDLGVRVVILHCLSMFGLRVLEQAASFNMTSAGWAWVVTDGLTTLRPEKVGDDARWLYGVVGTRPSRDKGGLQKDVNALWRAVSHTRRDLDVLQSRVVDAVLTFAFALRDLQSRRSGHMITRRLDCLSGRGWAEGGGLLEDLLQVDEDGVSGRIHFNADQSPAEVFYDYVNMQQSGWKKVGEWSGPGQVTVPGPVYLPGGRRTVPDETGRLQGRHLRVVVIDEAPFVLRPHPRPAHTTHLPRGEVSGYCIDLLDKLAETTGFTYDLYVVPDGIFGGKNQDTGQWNGIVNELVNRRADLAAAPFTITNVRERDIDFTKPFFDLGIGIVLQKPPAEPWDPFKFTQPFSGELWYYILGTTVLVGVYLTLLNRLSPYDRHGRFVYSDEPNQMPRALGTKRDYRTFKRQKIYATSELNLGNSLWLSVASLLHQGAEQYPRALSSRLSLLLWWMGVVILIATYTANLAAHLTSNRSTGKISSVEDLATQTLTLYGTVGDSSVYQFLADSEVPLYTDMVTFMRQRRTIVSNSSAGIERARQGQYAFLWDSAVLEYIVQQRPCDTLQTVGRTFGKSGYGFGLQKNSPYNRELSQHILALREQGFMEHLTRKWYTDTGECSSSNSDSSTEGGKVGRIGPGHVVDLDSGYIFTKLGIYDKIQGVFIIVWAGCGAGFLVLIGEWFVACASMVDKNNPKKPSTFRESFRRRWRAMKLDLWESFFHLCCKEPVYKTEVEELRRHYTLRSTQSHNPAIRLSPASWILGTESFPTSAPTPRRLQLPRQGILSRSLSQLDDLNSRQQAYLMTVRDIQSSNEDQSRKSHQNGGPYDRSHRRSHRQSHVASLSESDGMDNMAFSGVRYSTRARPLSGTTTHYGPYPV